MRCGRCGHTLPESVTDPYRGNHRDVLCLRVACGSVNQWHQRVEAVGEQLRLVGPPEACPGGALCRYWKHGAIDALP